MEQAFRIPPGSPFWKPAAWHGASSSHRFGRPDGAGQPDNPFAPEGGLKVLSGNLGRGSSRYQQWHRSTRSWRPLQWSSTIKTSCLPCLNRGSGTRLRGGSPFSGGREPMVCRNCTINHLPGVLQDRGFKVALVTDGRMSGASGKVPAAIHVYPEAASLGPLAKLQNGDRFDWMPRPTLSLLLTTRRSKMSGTEGWQ